MPPPAPVTMEVDKGHTHQQKIFFPNLDGLRFFSFVVVFFSHSFATSYDIKNEGWYLFFKGRVFSDGDIGVSFFFVLSGFLITYLLLKEKDFTGKIDVKSFYIRRILRIWPLYYLSVFIGFVIFPILKSYFGATPDETADPILCSVFLNNFNQIINGHPDSSILAILWSVAIEEQFYVVWPILFLLVPSKYYQYLFFAVIAASLLYRATHVGGYSNLHTLGVISDMAIGGLGAFFSIKSQRFVKWFENCPFFLSIIPYIAAIVILIFKQELFARDFMSVIKRLIIASFFIWIILDQNFSARKYFKVSQLKLISRLGKYTYGLYCLHSIAILISVVCLTKFGLNKHTWQLWLIEFPLSMGLSILISYLSYTFYENRFLKMKNRFAYIVKS